MSARLRRCLAAIVAQAFLAALLAIVWILIGSALAGAFGGLGAGAVPAVIAALVPALIFGGLVFLGGVALGIAVCLLRESRRRNAAAQTFAATAASAEPDRDDCYICEAGYRYAVIASVAGATGFLLSRFI